MEKSKKNDYDNWTLLIPEEIEYDRGFDGGNCFALKDRIFQLANQEKTAERKIFLSEVLCYLETEYNLDFIDEIFSDKKEINDELLHHEFLSVWLAAKATKKSLEHLDRVSKELIVQEQLLQLDHEEARKKVEDYIIEFLEDFKKSNKELSTKKLLAKKMRASIIAKGGPEYSEHTIRPLLSSDPFTSIIANIYGKS